MLKAIEEATEGSFFDDRAEVVTHLDVLFGTVVRVNCPFLCMFWCHDQTWCAMQEPVFREDFHVIGWFRPFQEMGNDERDVDANRDAKAVLVAVVG